ncbi:MAG: diaminopimelate epimerase [Lachnospiraceae bacterium]|nr:diaminopimelate epimerase [Lachnospiraceae bacterium]
MYDRILRFSKMEGCGNDYIYIDGTDGAGDGLDKTRLARELSDRHFGIGSDGVIWINRSQYADFEMEMYNADGSRAEMCGNGIRCVAGFVREHGMHTGNTVRIESFGKVKELYYLSEPGDSVQMVRVNMGEPVLGAADIPYAGNETEDPCSPVIDRDFEAGGKKCRITCVSMGNPHCVVFVDDTDSLDLEKIGPSFENHPAFPARVNTEFVQVISQDHVKMRVWERGSGETLACGTGCCASAVACVLCGKTDRKVYVDVLGGTLLIEWESIDGSDGTVWMTGPARTVFEGTIRI